VRTVDEGGGGGGGVARVLAVVRGRVVVVARVGLV